MYYSELLGVDLCYQFWRMHAKRTIGLDLKLSTSLGHAFAIEVEALLETASKSRSNLHLSKMPVLFFHSSTYCARQL